METDKTDYLKMRDVKDYSLKAHNTFGIEACCRRFVEFASLDEAREAARMAREEGGELLIVGGGSNLLLTKDFDGLVLHSAILGVDALKRDGEVLVTAGSGVEWDWLVSYCTAQGWHGMENLSLIPGDVGASAVQNIGAYGAEAKAIIDRVQAVRISDGEVVWFSNEECRYGYRESRFKHEWKNKYLITNVVYRLSERFEPRLDYGNLRSELQRKGISEPTAEQLRQVVIDVRRAKLPDPKELGNAGSFFMNPVVGREQFDRLLADNPQMPHYYIDEAHEKVPAGWLIDQCGWKGRTVGRAGVHDKQALVLVNRGGATGQEIVALCQSIQHDVQEKFGIVIQPEVNII